MLSITLESLTCLDDTTEWGHDEPYAIIASVIPGDLTAGRFPHAHVTLQTFPDTDAGDTHGAGLTIWGLDGQPAELKDPDDAIFAVALMEWDNGNRGVMRSLVSSVVTATLGANLSQPRDVLTKALLEDISGILRTPTGVPNIDDPFGVQELRLTDSDLAETSVGQEVRKTLSFARDGGRYTLTFLARVDRYFRSPDYRWSRREAYVFAEGDQPTGTVPMYLWYSPIRKDNFSTTMPQYTDPPVDFIAPGYRRSSQEGPVYIYSPDLPQPPNTVPLHRWWSPGRQDNATLTHPSWDPDRT